MQEIMWPIHTFAEKKKKAQKKPLINYNIILVYIFKATHT